MTAARVSGMTSVNDIDQPQQADRSARRPVLRAVAASAVALALGGLVASAAAVSGFHPSVIPTAHSGSATTSHDVPPDDDWPW
jgi:hypothetical protein